jgi:hypothetical protein
MNCLEKKYLKKLFKKLKLLKFNLLEMFKKVFIFIKKRILSKLFKKKKNLNRGVKFIFLFKSLKFCVT